MTKKLFAFFKILIRFVVIGCILAGSFLYISDALRVHYFESPNDTTNKVRGFYALQKNSMNVLFMGTSHSYYGFNPGQFYEQTGLNSYIFAGECQPMAVTYYYVVEALKTQSPDVIVLDVFSLLPTSQGCQTQGIIQKNLQDFNFSENKLEAMELIENEEDQKNAKYDLLMYRSRWSELELSDWLYPFSDQFNDQFGFTEGWPSSSWVDERPVLDYSERTEPKEEQLDYLYKIIDLLNEKEIQLILFKTPFYELQEDYDTMLVIEEIATGKNIPLIDMNRDYSRYNFVFTIDADVWHCNVKGATKVTNVISNYINSYYDIRNKNDSTYEEKYKDLYLSNLRTVVYEQHTLEEFSYLDTYTDMSWIIVYSSKEWSLIDEERQSYLSKMGFELNLVSDYNKNYVLIKNNNQKIDSVISENNIAYTTTVQGHEINIDTSNTMCITVDGKPGSMECEGINILLIDNLTGEILFPMGINTYSYYRLCY